MKQTAVQYLIEEMQQRIPTFYAHYVMNMYEVYNKALEMEKEQIRVAYMEGAFEKMRHLNGKEFILPEQYYKENYEAQND